MTLKQTVDIPDDRRLHFDWVIPREIPTGKAQMEVKIIPFPVKKRMSAEEELEAINKRADFLNKQAEETLKYQVDIWERGEPVE